MPEEFLHEWFEKQKELGRLVEFSILRFNRKVKTNATSIHMHVFDDARG